MKKKQAESNPNPVLRREALASDVERFLKSGKKIEQIPSGVSAQTNLGSAKPQATQGNVKKPAESTTSAESTTPTESAASVESTAPTETAASVESAAPAETAESAVPTETAAPKAEGSTS